MNKLDLTKAFAVGSYVAPAVEVCDYVAEKGFSASVPGVAINPWENDGDNSLEF